MARSGASLSKARSIVDVPDFAARREVGAILAVFVLVLVGSLIRADVFWSSGNLIGIVRNTATIAIIGYGMTLLIVSGEFDLSVGSWMAVAMALTAILFLEGWPLLLVMGIVLLLSLIYGLFQGLLVTKLGLPSLIVTIGTLTLLRGVVLVLTESLTISIPSERIGGMYYLGGAMDLTGIGLGITRFPIQIVWLFVALGVMYYILNKTAFGLRSQFTGGDADSSRRTGIKTDHVKIINFMLIAALAAFAGMTQLAFTRSVGPLTGQGIELTVIAAVVIGGTNLFGGEGSMPGTLLGALVFAITQNVLVLAGLGTQLFQIFSGIFIILAVLVEVLSKDLRPATLVTQYINPLTELVSKPVEFFHHVRTDVQGVDKPIAFLAISTLNLSALTLAFLLIGDALTPWEFDFLFVSAGISAIGTIPVVMFGLVTALALLSATFLHAVVKTAFGSTEDFDTTLQAAMYSLTPSVLLFVPILLAGWDFLGVVVLATAAVIAIPSLYLLYNGVKILHGLSTRDAIVSVGFTVFAWIILAVYVTLRIPPA